MPAGSDDDSTPARDRTAPAVVQDLGALLGSALAASSDGLTICDATLPDLPMVHVNPAFEQLTGYGARDLLGRNARLLQSPDTDQAAVAAVRAGLDAGREVRAVLRNQRPDGSRWWNEMHLVPVRAPSGRVTHWVGTQRDVTDRVEAQQQAAHLAHSDALTGLANRRRLTEHLPAEIGRAGRTGTSIALLYLDLDGFKEVNDTHGHDTGDRLLVAIAGRLRDHVRVGDLLVRQGGDEFLLVLSGLPAAPDAAARAARETADKLRAELRAPFRLEAPAGVLSTGVSIGISLWPHDARDAGQLLAQADAALYLVKAGAGGATLLHGEGAAPPAPRGEDRPPSGAGTAAALRDALTPRAEVQQAVGLLMGRHGLDAAEALGRLAALSREQRRPLEDAARAVLLTAGPATGSGPASGVAAGPGVGGPA